MGHWNLSDVASAVGAAPSQQYPADLAFDSVTTDSRAVPQGSLFVALRGEHFDGHAFVQSAVDQGAAAVLVDTQGAATLGALGVPMLVVRDTLHGLGDLAAWSRRHMARPVAAVTGSNGKTTTKELLAAALGAQAPVHKTQGNLNNLIGVPLTLLRWERSAWAAVVEMGMNAPGEIARLTEIAQPDVGLITCVAAAHLEGLGTLEAVARAKCELFAGLGASATAVINTDDTLLLDAAQAVVGDRRVVRFGSDNDNDVQLLAAESTPTGLKMTLSFAGQPTAISVPLVGRHNAMNTAGAAAAAWAMGLQPSAIARGLAQVRVPGGRLRVLRDVGIGLNVIDDTYNANPGSMRAAFSTLQDLAGGNRRITVIGDMFELGPTAPELHRQVGEAAAQTHPQVVWAVGPLAEHTAAGARAAGVQAHAFADVETLQKELLSTLQKNDWLLIKGSRGMRMERLVESVVGGRV